MAKATVKRANAQQETPTDIMSLARIAGENQIARARLFNQTELSQIMHTPENIDTAVRTVRMMTEQTRTLLEMSVTQRGMYLCWLKSGNTTHGEWEKFCADRFPEISKRTRCRWMAAYLVAVGEKVPKELPAHTDLDLEDAELQGAVDSLTDDTLQVVPRSELIAKVKRLTEQVSKGKEQLEEQRARMADLEDAADGVEKFIPDEVRDEAGRIEWIRGHMGKLLNEWASSLPADAAALRLHLGLFVEFQEMLNDWRGEHLVKAKA